MTLANWHANRAYLQEHFTSALLFNDFSLFNSCLLLNLSLSLLALLSSNHFTGCKIIVLIPLCNNLAVFKSVSGSISLFQGEEESDKLA